MFVRQATQKATRNASVPNLIRFRKSPRACYNGSWNRPRAKTTCLQAPGSDLPSGHCLVCIVPTLPHTKSTEMNKSSWSGRVHSDGAPGKGREDCLDAEIAVYRYHGLGVLRHEASHTLLKRQYGISTPILLQKENFWSHVRQQRQRSTRIGSVNPDRQKGRWCFSALKHFDRISS